MSSISIEEKLALLKQMREENEKNQAKLQSRRAVLCGGEQQQVSPQNEESESPYYPKSTLKFRLIFSILLIAFVVVCHRLDKCIVGYDAKDLDNWIAEEKIMNEAFYEKISIKP